MSAERTAPNRSISTPRPGPGTPRGAARDAEAPDTVGHYCLIRGPAAYHPIDHDVEEARACRTYLARAARR